MKKEFINIFIHRRDLRILDNTALDLLYKTDPNTPIMHIFIFTPQQIDPKLNKYYSKNSAEFLVQSLHDLNIQLNDSLHCFYGKDIDVLSNLIPRFYVNHIAFNLDYTPYAIKRDKDIIQWCKNKGISCISEEDYTLFPMKGITNGQGDVYEIFTPFYNKCLKKIKEIREPEKTHTLKKVFRNKQLTFIIKNIDKFYFNDANPNLALKGGRKNALEIIKKKIETGFYKNYEKSRNFPAENKTTKLSSYIKYGCVSIREVFNSIKKTYGQNHELLRELFWREFYAHVSYNHPRVLCHQVQETKNKAFREKYENIPWKYNEKYWSAFIEGRTGFPFVDAGIRQLLTTGWCHNRARMVIAAFAAKDLYIPSDIVERWFASNLIDYDPCSNSGGIQWCYGIGCDSMFIYRFFNPNMQSIKFDNNCFYIKKYIPELKNVSAKDIHTWNINYKKYNKIQYPEPIVDHNIQISNFKAMLQRLGI